jgi:2'-5' RNA ligase
MDLFPESLQPEALGFGAIPLVAACFFALYPDEAARDLISEQQRKHCRRLGLDHSTWRSPELFHLSIARWGAAKKIHRPLDDALKSARTRFFHTPINVELVSTARLSAQDGEYAFVFEASAETAKQMRSLRDSLAAAQLHSGLVAPRGAIRPHVTLAYSRHVPDEVVQIPPIRFRAMSVEMIASQRGAGMHHHLDQWSLHEQGRS